MTKLIYKIDKLHSTDVETIDIDYFLEIISETCFFLPVRLCVDGKDIFQMCKINSEEVRNWIILPAFSIILNWKKSLENLLLTGKERIFLADAGQMILLKSHDQLTISTNFNDVSVITSYNSFVSGIYESISNLSGEIKSKFPDIFDQEELKNV